MTMQVLQPETVQVVPVTVTVDDVAVDAADVELAVARDEARPDTWAAPTVLAGGKYGVLVSDLTSGVWTVYARVSANPETPVIPCGKFAVP